MTKLKTFAATALLAATIGAAGLATAPAASAMPRYTCEEATLRAEIYFAHANVFYAVGDYATYWDYRFKAENMLRLFC